MGSDPQRLPSFGGMSHKKVPTSALNYVDKYYKLVLHVSGYKRDSVPDR